MRTRIMPKPAVVITTIITAKGVIINRRIRPTLLQSGSLYAIL